MEQKTKQGLYDDILRMGIPKDVANNALQILREWEEATSPNAEQRRPITGEELIKLSDEELCAEINKIRTRLGMGKREQQPPSGPWSFEVHHEAAAPESGCSGDEYVTITDGKVTLIFEQHQDEQGKEKIVALLNLLQAKISYDRSAEHVAAYYKEQLDKLAAEQPQDIDDNTYYDLSALSQEEKLKFVTEVGRSVVNSLMRTFYSLGLESHIDQMATNGTNGDEFIMAFRKIIDGKLQGPPLPHAEQPQNTAEGETETLISKLEENISLHMNPYNLGDMGETTNQIRQLIGIVRAKASQPVAGMRWVNVSERRPVEKKQNYIFRQTNNTRSAMVIYLDHTPSISAAMQLPIENIQWLDEQAPASPAKEDAVDFAEWILENKYRPIYAGWWLDEYSTRYMSIELYNLYTQSKK